MYVTFLARFNVDSSPKTKRAFEKEQEEKRIKYLIGKTLEEEEVFKKPKYEYSKITVDVKNDVRLWNEYDDDHTTVALAMGASYVFKIPFEEFQMIVQLAKGNIRIAYFEEFIQPLRLIEDSLNPVT